MTPVFFKPDNKFLEWMIQTANDRIIFDIGFGSGHVLKKLSAKGYNKLMGIEPFFDPMSFREDWLNEMDTEVPHVFQEQIGEGIHMSLFQNMGSEKLVAFLCRPCHHPLLVEMSYKVCKMHNVELYYIGLEKNLELDLYFMEELNFVKHDGKSMQDEVTIKLV